MYGEEVSDIPRVKPTLFLINGEDEPQNPYPEGSPAYIMYEQILNLKDLARQYVNTLSGKEKELAELKQAQIDNETQIKAFEAAIAMFK
jgi:hypothetical protein